MYGMTISRADIELLKTEFATKADMTVVKTDIAELKSDVGEIKSGFNRMALRLVRLETDTAEIKQAITTTMATKADIERFFAYADKMLEKGRAYDAKSLSHGDMPRGHEARSGDHERRLNRLEEPGPASF